MQVLDLFSGIGGFSLGLERAGMKTAAFCEIDPYCRAVLAKHWPEVPCYHDIRTIREEFLGTVDLICGGYPCQPVSMAGKRKGKNDDRYLWPEMFACIQHYRPAWVVAENVAGHISMGLDGVLSDLEGEEYTCWPLVIPAAGVAALHRRDRVWIIARRKDVDDTESIRRGLRHTSHFVPTGGNEHASCNAGEVMANAYRSGERRMPRKEGAAPSEGEGKMGGEIREWIRLQLGGGSEDEFVSYTAGERWKEWQGFTEDDAEKQPSPQRGCRWRPEPNVGRVAYGVPRRVDRIRCLGNAVVPQIPEIIGLAIMAVHHARA